MGVCMVFSSPEVTAFGNGAHWIPPLWVIPLLSPKCKRSFSACRCTLLWGKPALSSFPSVNLKEFLSWSCEQPQTFFFFLSGLRMTVSFSSWSLHSSLLKHVFVPTESKGQHVLSLSAHISICTYVCGPTQAIFRMMGETETTATKRPSTRIPFSGAYEDI